MEPHLTPPPPTRSCPITTSLLSAHCACACATTKPASTSLLHLPTVTDTRPRRAVGEWSPAELFFLRVGHAKLGNRWDEILGLFRFHGRTGADLKEKWHQLRRAAEDRSGGVKRSRVMDDGDDVEPVLVTPPQLPSLPVLQRPGQPETLCCKSPPPMIQVVSRGPLYNFEAWSAGFSRKKLMDKVTAQLVHVLAFSTYKRQQLRMEFEEDSTTSSSSSSSSSSAATTSRASSSSSCLGPTILAEQQDTFLLSKLRTAFFAVSRIVDSGSAWNALAPASLHEDLRQESLDMLNSMVLEVALTMWEKRRDPTFAAMNLRVVQNLLSHKRGLEPSAENTHTPPATPSNDPRIHALWTDVVQATRKAVAMVECRRKGRAEAVQVVLPVLMALVHTLDSHNSPSREAMPSASLALAKALWGTLYKMAGRMAPLTPEQNRLSVVLVMWGFHAGAGAGAAEEVDSPCPFGVVVRGMGRSMGPR